MNPIFKIMIQYSQTFFIYISQAEIQREKPRNQSILHYVKVPIGGDKVQTDLI